MNSTQYGSVLPAFEYFINIINQYTHLVSVFWWSTLFGRFIHVVVYSHCSFIFFAVEYSTVRKCHNLFIISVVYGHIACFHVGYIKKNAVGLQSFRLRAVLPPPILRHCTESSSWCLNVPIWRLRSHPRCTCRWPEQCLLQCCHLISSLPALPKCWALSLRPMTIDLRGL